MISIKIKLMMHFMKDKRIITIIALVAATLVVAAAFSFAEGENTKRTQKILSDAKSKIGSDYQMGAEGENTFDGSGFVYWVFQIKNRLELAKERGTADDYSQIGKEVAKDSLKEGDLLFFNKDARGGKIHHVGIYIGNGKFIHASQILGKVVESNLSDHIGYTKKQKTYDQLFVGARRITDSTRPVTAISLKPGDSSPTVRILQVDLKSVGYDVKTDGTFGLDTETAIKMLQSETQLPSDGIVTPKIWEMIRELKTQIPVVPMT